MSKFKIFSAFSQPGDSVAVPVNSRQQGDGLSRSPVNRKLHSIAAAIIRTPGRTFLIQSSEEHDSQFLIGGRGATGPTVECQAADWLRLALNLGQIPARRRLMCAIGGPRHLQEIPGIPHRGDAHGPCGGSVTLQPVVDSFVTFWILRTTRYKGKVGQREVPTACAGGRRVIWALTSHTHRLRVGM